MAFRLRSLLTLVCFGLLSPLAAQAQTAGTGAPATLPGIAGQPGTGLTSPTIGNTVLQRQQRTGRQTDQVLDPRTGLPIDPRTQQIIQDLQPPQERIEFQDFVAQSTGRDLPIFGADLFKNVPSTFAQVDNIPVTNDYLIGPGDEIMIRAWGQLDIDFSAVVDRTGTINIPKVGTISVAGIKYQDLQSHIKTAIGRVFRNFDLSVSLGQLRAIQVLVVGQARRPGSYTVGSMSTLVNAIFAAGGPSAKGSMRGIQLKRGNKVIAELDMYDLLIKGDKSEDAKLLPGDVIYIPPVGAMVAISGSVNVPAIFELKQDGSLADLLAWADGLASTASGQKATVERIDDQRTRKLAEFKLDATGMQAKLQNGDVVTIYAIAPRIDNAVTLRGNVAQPGRFPWRQGMRVKDLIPRVEALLSRHYWLRKNQTAGLDDTIADLLRRNRAAGVEISVTDLLTKNQQSQQQEANATVAEAMRRNQIAADVATASPEVAANISNVGATTVGATTANVAAAGASSVTKSPSAALGLGVSQGNQAGAQGQKIEPKLADEIKRNLNEVNWNYAVIERMNPKDLSTTLVPFNLGKAILDSDPAQNLLLQPGDVVTIFSVDDIQVPIAKQTKYVRLEGSSPTPAFIESSRVKPCASWLRESAASARTPMFSVRNSRASLPGLISRKSWKRQSIGWSAKSKRLRSGHPRI